MNLEPFYARCRAMPANDQRWAKLFCDTLDGLFDDELFEDMLKVNALFYGKSNGLSKAQYYRKRKFVVEFYKWLCEEQLVSDSFLNRVKSLKLDDIISEEELRVYYFASLESAVNFITQTGARFGLSERGDLLLIKTTVILSWYLVQLNEMVNIKKSDLNLTNCEITIQGRDPIAIPKQYFDIVKLFADTDVHKSFPGQKTCVYQASRYLFRSSQHPKLTENSIRCQIEKFNSESKGQLLSFTALKKNGIFARTLENEARENTISIVMQELSGVDRQISFGYSRFYKRWKEKFYPKEVNS